MRVPQEVTLCLGWILFLVGASSAAGQSSPAANEIAQKLARGEVGPAIEFGRSVLEAHRGDPAFREQLGRAYFILAETLEQSERPLETIDRSRREAIVHLNSALELSRPATPSRVFHALAALHFHLHEYATTIQVATDGLSIHAHETALRQLRARAHGKVGSWRESIVDWNVILRANPSDIDAAVDRSEAWTQLGFPCDAAEKLREACLSSENAPGRNSWRVQYSLGRFWLMCHRYEDAMEPLHRAGALAPQNGMIAIERAENLYRLGHIEDATKVFDTWIEKLEQLDRPQRIVALHRRGRIAVADADPELATRCYQRALELDPSHPGALQGLGSLLRLQGEPDRAREMLQRFARIAPIALDMRIARQMIARNPQDDKSRITLMRQLFSIPEPVAARLELDDFARRFPRHPELITLREQLGAIEATAEAKKKPAGASPGGSR